MLENHIDYDLQQLFRLAKIIKGNIDWLVEANFKVVVVTDPNSLDTYVEYLEVVRLFMNYPKLYSWNYIYFMESELTRLGILRLNTTEEFLKLLNSGKIKFDNLLLSTQLKRYYEIESGSYECNTEAGNYLLCHLDSVRLDQFIGYIEIVVNTKEADALIQYIKEGKEPATV